MNLGKGNRLRGRKAGGCLGKEREKVSAGKKATGRGSWGMNSARSARELGHTGHVKSLDDKISHW